LDSTSGIGGTGKLSNVLRSERSNEDIIVPCAFTGMANRK
jgi:hypothetical protein